MEWLFLVAGMLFSACFPARKDPMIRFLSKQVAILLRILGDQGIQRTICTPAERADLLAIGSELEHKVQGIFLINTWGTYRRWLQDRSKGKEPGRPGRPPKYGADVIALVVRLARENLAFGLGKIVGEMKKLGISLSTTTVRTILRKHNTLPPDGRGSTAPSCWRKLHANLDSLVACDFLTKPVYTLFGKFDAYVLVFIHLGSRRVWMSPATISPTGEWCYRQARQVAMWIEDEGVPFRHLIRDNDTKFTERFDAVFKELSEADRPICRTGIAIPRMNSYAETFIGHFKAECLNHFVCFSLEQLDHIVRQYEIYHNSYRPHQGEGIGNQPLDPDWHPPPPVGLVRRHKMLGGLLNHYYRDAA